MSLIDETEALARFDNDREIYLELINAFLETGLADFKAMQESIAAKDTGPVLYCTHKVKGAALTIGADSLAHASANLELILRGNHEGNAETALATMERIYRETLADLSAIRDRLQKQS